MNVSMAQAKPGSMMLARQTRPKILFHYIWHTLPLVKLELKRWKSQAHACPDQALRLQALNSLNNKDFHCYGGAVFALAGSRQEKPLIKLIVAYQTICDYLDNLCDRNDCLDGAAFRQLHAALLDALQPEAPGQDYYALYPNRDDGGYLDKLVEECRYYLKMLPAYKIVYPAVHKIVHYYIELQVKKHIQPEQREKTLISWAEEQAASFPDIFWQEFAAASGSTLALFALLALASHPNASEADVQETMTAYFPWICGLHILLDYFIDQEEDRQGGDLNFTFYYANQEETVQRLIYFIKQSDLHSRQIKNEVFAQTVIEGLLALYLSDSKIKRQGYQQMAGSLLDQSGSDTWRTYRICSVVRRFF